MFSAWCAVCQDAPNAGQFTWKASAQCVPNTNGLGVNPPKRTFLPCCPTPSPWNIGWMMRHFDELLWRTQTTRQGKRWTNHQPNRNWLCAFPYRRCARARPGNGFWDTSRKPRNWARPRHQLGGRPRLPTFPGAGVKPLLTTSETEWTKKDQNENWCTKNAQRWIWCFVFPKIRPWHPDWSALVWI